MADRRTLSTRIASILSTTVARGRVGTLAAALVLTGAAALAAAIAPVKAVGAQPRERDALTIPTSTDGPTFEVVSVKPNEPDDRLRVNDWQPVTGRLVLRNLTPKVVLDVRVRKQPHAVSARRASGRRARMGRQGTLHDRSHRRPSGHCRGDAANAAARARRSVRASRASGATGTDGLPPGQGAAGILDRTNLHTADEGKCKVSRRPRGGSEAWGPQELILTTIHSLAADLSERLGRPVLNQTGLTGLYDGTLSYAPSAEELAVIYQLTPSELPPAAHSGPSLTTALQEQLGLKLESTRAAIDVLVVDGLERPTPNDAPLPSTPQGASAGQRLSFEVASVRQNKSGLPISRGPMIQPGNRLVAQNVMARVLITTAYRLRHEQVVGGPAWLDTDLWDIEARARENASLEDVHAMLRTLLAERFGLVARRETRQQDSARAGRGRRQADDSRPAPSGDSVCVPAFTNPAADCVA